MKLFFVRNFFWKIPFLVTIFLLISACQKETIIADYDFETVKKGFCIEDILFLDNGEVLACGGERYSYGNVYKKTDSVWVSLISMPQKFNRIYQSMDNELYFCGDKMQFLHSPDSGKTNFGYPKFKYFWTYDSTNLKDIVFFTKNRAIMSGSCENIRGNIYRTSDKGAIWSSKQINNGIEKIRKINDSTGFMVGYGVIYKIRDYGKKIDTIDIKGDIYTGVSCSDQNNIFVCSYQGAIYHSSDTGATWSKIMGKNMLFSERIHFNDILFINTEEAYIAGEKGILFYTHDRGLSWERVQKFTEADLNIIVYYNSTVYFGASNGNIYSIKN